MDRTTPANFVDRRTSPVDSSTEWVERRQFVESRSSMDPDVRELAEAIDGYKLANRRRHVTLEEVLTVVKSLGYQR